MLVRNYRPDGSLFWNETVIQPVRTAGKLTHFVGYHRDASERLKHAEREQPACPPGCAKTASPRCTHARTSRNCCGGTGTLAQRDSHEIGLTLFDIDDLGAYNDNFDRAAGDACIRRVARVIGASYRRGGDLVGPLGRRHLRRADAGGRPPSEPRTTPTW